jgi:hypothetical protein
MRHSTAIFAASLLCATSAHADDEIPPVVGGKTYTQHMVVTAKARHPEIVSIVVEGKHGNGNKGDVAVLGSTSAPATVLKSVARPDMSTGGKVSSDSQHYVSRLSFNSSTGHRIGTIAITFAHKKGASTAAHDATAQAIAASMARSTLSPKNAADPYPWDPKFSPDTYGQQLAMRMVAKYPDLLVIMIHATPPGGGKNVVIGSNIGRIGKIADEDDLRVIEKGSTNLEVGGDDNDRFETEVPLNDASGKRIGALGLVFAYNAKTDKDAVHAHGRAIRDDLARHIPASAALFKPAR